MKFKILKNSAGEVICYGPNDDNYVPVIPPGCHLEFSDQMPSASKAQMWERIKAKREHLSDTGGYKVVVGGVDKWFHSDAKSKGQQIGLVLAGAAAAGVPPWKTMDGSKVVMSQALAGQIFQAAMQMEGAIFQAAEAHRTAMEASADPAKYDFSSGWPAAFPG